MYYRARYYHPALGRFVSADTIVPDPANSQSLNRYAYVLNNPLRYVDPSGYFPTEELMELFGFDNVEDLDAYLSTLGEGWEEVLFNADWQDQVMIGNRHFMFVYGVTKRGWTSEVDRFSLAFWDMEERQSIHFMSVVSLSAANQPQLITTANTEYMKPMYGTSECYNQNEYIVLKEVDDQWLTDHYMFRLNVLTLGLSGNISEAISVAIGAVDNLYDAYQTESGYGSRYAIPRKDKVTLFEGEYWFYAWARMRAVSGPTRIR
jgi:hypothetical protein